MAGTFSQGYHDLTMKTKTHSQTSSQLPHLENENDIPVLNKIAGIFMYLFMVLRYLLKM